MSVLGRDVVTSLGNSSALCVELQTSAGLAFIVLYSLLFLVGLCLNAVSLKVYFCSRAQASSSVTVYLQNLAAADLFLSLSLPLRIAHYTTNPAHYVFNSTHNISGPAPFTSGPTHSVFQWLYCSFGAGAFYLNMYASILFMGHIAASRFLKIVRPFSSHFLLTPRGATVVCGASWLFLGSVAGAYVGLALFGSRSDAPVHSLSCDSSHGVELSWLYFLVHVCGAAVFLCVLLALVFFYSSVSRRLAAARARQPQSSSSRKLHRAQRNMLLLGSVFCVCFVPYHGVRLSYLFLKRGHCSQTLFFLKELAVLLSALNVCLDPIIYLLFSQAFRSQLGLDHAFAGLHSTTASANTNAKANCEANAGAKANSEANTYGRCSSEALSRANRRGSLSSKETNSVT